jgi:hypothetical protein
MSENRSLPESRPESNARALPPEKRLNAQLGVTPLPVGWPFNVIPANAGIQAPGTG